MTPQDRLSGYWLRFAGLRVHACRRASSIRCSEWNPGGKIGHDQISGESRATYFSVASRAGAIVTFSGGAVPFAALLATFAMATRKASGATGLRSEERRVGKEG